jgi:hypothetical protein
MCGYCGNSYCEIFKELPKSLRDLSITSCSDFIIVYGMGKFVVFLSEN